MGGLYEQFRLSVHSVWTRRWLALAVVWTLCLLGWLGIALIPNSYESKAKVFVQMQSILPDKLGITPAERQSDMLRVKQLITSTENLQKVVRRTDLNQLVASERDLAAQVEALRKDIKVAAQQDNLNILEITASAGVSGFSNAQNARTAAAIVQNLLDLFVEENLSGNRVETGQSLAFLDEELKKREAELQQAEQRRIQFEQRFLGMLPGEGTIAQRVSAARSELGSIEQMLVAAQSSLGALRNQMAATPASIAMPVYAGGGDAAVGASASAQMAALEAQLSQARARGWTDQHPDVMTTRAQIDRLRPVAAREKKSGGGAAGTPNPAYSSLRALAAEREAQIAAAMVRKNQLQQALTQLAQIQATEPDLMAEQARLSRDYEVLRRQYEKLLEDREQVQLRGDVQTKTSQINFKIIDPPSKPNIPSAPNRPLFLTGILIVALGAGVGAAFAKGQLQTTFPTSTRLEEATGLPVLGSIGEVVTAARKAERQQRLKWFTGAGAALAASYALLMLIEFWQRSTVA